MRYLILEIEDAKVAWTAAGFFGIPAIVVSALGKTNTSGWSDPLLLHGSFVTAPADGVLEFDFTAVAPRGQVDQTKTRTSCITALYVPNWVRGIRVKSSTNSVERMLTQPTNEQQILGDGMPGPWPFPWFVPEPTR